MNEYKGPHMLGQINKNQVTKGHGFIYRGHCGHPPLSLTTIVGKGPLLRPMPAGWQCVHAEFLEFIWMFEVEKV